MKIVTEHEEILDVVERLQDALELVACRGLRVAGPAELDRLSSLRDELEELGAAHLSSLLVRLLRSVREGLRQSAEDLLRLQAALRVFERLLCREAAADRLLALAADAPEQPSIEDAGTVVARGRDNR